ncbi:polysaccharide biosynthesis/export family protein [Haliangium ochraceum]|uniref:Polysaccharide export protein n=1 Tax=Haliangium ochraceum (strain DSM 14365 / JCM 11303 / SMP-2) TaxID=502025 RepID=D0LHJ0_HALO1|nr:polysaccharide biosynthesis/export family protein [Haliangium ochraceum]ACY12852.1 polysaccharide export protein [Haliangium ochraceum DSM 14365]
MKRTIYILAAMLVLACHACGGAPPPTYDYSQEPDPRRLPYVLGVGDSLEINVWKNPDLTTSVTVRPDGIITMPLIGDLYAAGKTTEELKKEIEAQLANYIKLEVTKIAIKVTNATSNRFTVSGEVAKPSTFQSPYYVTVAEAIALAGGFSRFADRTRMRLLRRDHESGEVRTIPIDYTLIESGERPDMNLVLMPGDALYVP